MVPPVGLDNMAPCLKVIPEIEIPKYAGRPKMAVGRYTELALKAKGLEYFHGFQG